MRFKVSERGISPLYNGIKTALIGQGTASRGTKTHRG